MSYNIPAKPVIDEQIIKKSRFITYIQRSTNKEEAVAFIKQIKAAHPDARHHCWAYIAGHPTASIDVAFSDDGEPQGTAGKPILNVLQHRDIGEIALVVVRYFGGIKLGAGGLVRAYSSSAHLAVEKLETMILVPTKKLIFFLNYELENKVQHYLKEQNITVTKSDYAERITLEVEVSEQALEITKHALMDITSGKVFF